MKKDRQEQQRKPADAKMPGLIENVVSAFQQFLWVPTAISIGYLVVAGFAYWLDSSQASGVRSMSDFIQRFAFNTASTTENFLTTLTGGLMTVASITFSLLLLVLQQTASSLSQEVVDQYIHRRTNQVLFGIYVGTVIYTLVTLATHRENFNRVYGACFAMLFAILALYLLIFIMYETINQMKPDSVIMKIHYNTLAARQDELPLLQNTRRKVQFHGSVELPVKSVQHGFVNSIGWKKINQAINQARDEVEAELLILMGTSVTFGSNIAIVRANNAEDAALVGAAVQEYVHLGRQKDIKGNYNYGLEQLEMIAWTSGSASKQTFGSALLVLSAVTDLTARWLETRDEAQAHNPFPIVYHDNIWTRVWDIFTALGVVSTESMQFQVYSEVMRSLTVLYERLPGYLQDRVDLVIRQLLPGLGDHMPAGDLYTTLEVLSRTVRETGHTETADDIDQALIYMNAVVGHVSNRGLRPKYIKFNKQQIGKPHKPEGKQPPEDD